MRRCGRRGGAGTAVLAALVALAAALSGGVPAHAADPPRRTSIERTPEFVGAVNDAIDGGVAWLRSAQQADGSFGDYDGYPCALDALVYHTLRVCGVPREDPAAVRAYAALRRRYEQGGGSLRTYSAAVVLMAIAEHGDRVDRPERDVRLGPEDRRWAEDVARRLARSQTGDGVWSYEVQADGPYARGGRGRDAGYDHSNTQYALLGLKAAARCGVPVPDDVWLGALKHFVGTQAATGPEVARSDPAAAPDRATTARETDRARGWNYFGPAAPESAYGSMTAGAVGSLVLCRSELMGGRSLPRSLEARSETAVRDGLAWLGTHLAVTHNPGRGAWHGYWLYALERAGVLAGVDRMAGRDWYGEGALYLCDTQEDDGRWRLDRPAAGGRRRGRGPRAPAAGAAAPQAVLDTCYALLFLKKGTVPVRRGALTRASDDADIDFAAGARTSGQDFEDFLDLVLQRWRRSDDAAVRQRLFAGATSAGPKIVEPLLVRMDAPDAADRAAAHALLRFATGVDHGYDPAAERLAREDAVLRWQAWWLGARATLRYDGARLVDGVGPR